jgi:hypothetical protein
MGNIVVMAANRADLALLLALAKRLGLSSFELTEAEMRWLARRKLVETVDSFPLNPDISEEDINTEVEQVRASRHARKTA